MTALGVGEQQRPAWPPSAPGLPMRKVQLAMWAKDRAVTKAVLRAGESREAGKAGPGRGLPGPQGCGPAPAQGHVATASR